MRAILTVALLGAAWAAHAVSDPVAVLQSGASIEEKAAACRALQRVGGEGSVPVLAALLTDQQLAHMARLALETMPYPEVDEVLRAALANTEGELRAGIINSLGNRRDAGAVPVLIPLLEEGNPAIVQAAGRALGRIATPPAAEALFAVLAREGLDAATRAALYEGLLTAAESTGGAGIYDRLRADEAAMATVRAAAFRGAVLTRGAAGGTPLLAEGLLADDEALFGAALRTAQEMPDSAAPVLVGALPRLNGERKSRLIQVMGELGDEAAGPALLTVASGGETSLRVAALHALTRLGYEPVLDLVAGLLHAEDAALAAAARNTLSFFPAGAGDAALLAMLHEGDVASRKIAVELAGRGALPRPVDLLAEVAENDPAETVRVAALAALRTHAGEPQIPALLTLVTAARSGEERAAAESALTALCTRLLQGGSGEVTILTAAYGDLPGGAQADVTAKVAALVASGMRVIDASNAHFGDTAPNVPKQLRVTYAVHGMETTKTVAENTALTLGDAAVPAAVTQQFLNTHAQATGEARLAMLRLLGATASPGALARIRESAESATGAEKEAAIRELAKWPNLDALEPVMALALESGDATVKVLGLRGAVRLLRQSGYPEGALLAHYEKLMAAAETPDGRKLVLSALGDLSSPAAFEVALGHMPDDAVRSEAVQAAAAIAARWGENAREDAAFFNGADLTGWSGPEGYWSVVEGAIVGASDAPIPRNVFLWSDGEQSDFYLVLDVKLEPNTANAGIQFRSKPVDEYGQAQGYQADMGAEVWGRLYHEHGRGKLFWDGRAEAAVKPGEWNRYEILAVGPAIWTAINGTLGVAYLDHAPERTGRIAFQVHGGPPQEVSYRIVKIVHNPKVELDGLDTATLISALNNGGGSE